MARTLAADRTVLPEFSTGLDMAVETAPQVA